MCSAVGFAARRSRSAARLLSATLAASSAGRASRLSGRPRGLANPVRRGQPQAEARTAARSTLDGDLTAHHLREVPADREAESRTPVGARVSLIHLHERLEDSLEILARDTDAAVGDG